MTQVEVADERRRRTGGPRPWAEPAGAHGRPAGPAAYDDDGVPWGASGAHGGHPGPLPAELQVHTDRRELSGTGGARADGRPQRRPALASAPDCPHAGRRPPQKQMLGEKLFLLIQRLFPDLAGKVTDLLL